MLGTHEMLARAIALAAKVHETQEDKAGRAYILHPIRVMMNLNTDDPELMSIAILHDVVEDIDYIAEAELRQFGLSERIISGVMALTRDEGQSYEEFIAEKVSKNPDAVLVKKADLKDNMDTTRLDTALSDRDLKRLRKYHVAYRELNRL